MKKCVVCHYGEIALKGKNRHFFVKKLVSNIKEFFPDAKVLSPYGRIVLFTEEKDVENKIKKIPGIDYFFVAEIAPSSIEKIKEKVVSLLGKKEFNTFRITTKRSDKSFSLSSPEVSSILGEVVVSRSKKKVNLSSPDITCFVEITSVETYVYFEKIRGVGGIPVSSSGKAISLISGGIDSPVASFYMMKRGLKNIFLHFHAYPSTSKQSICKVERIVKELSLFQGSSVLYLVPFDEIQREIMLNCKESLRILLYRRFMMRIAENLAKKERAGAIITGESLGQVASQTVENITVTGSVVDLPVFRPLIGQNKEEITREAERINTYKISILPEEDCCVRFLPKNPATKGKINELVKEESFLKIEELIENALKNIEKKTVF